MFSMALLFLFFSLAKVTGRDQRDQRSLLLCYTQHLADICVKVGWAALSHLQRCKQDHGVY